jgi:hypothetical protein
MAADPRCRQRAASEASRLAPPGLENDEGSWGHPRGTKADAHHRFDDAIQRSEELHLKGALSSLHPCHLAA